jgi:hypothetical protein
MFGCGGISEYGRRQSKFQIVGARVKIRNLG